MMKKIVYFLALVLGTGLLFSCSDSNDDPWIHPVPYPKTITKEIFNVKDLLPKLQIGDSLVLVSKNPFNIEDLQYADVTMRRGYGHESAPIWNDSVFEYQKMRLDWLTLVHSTDSTLVLKADGNYNPTPIEIYVGFVGPKKTSQGWDIISRNNVITVTRKSIEGK